MNIICFFFLVFIDVENDVDYLIWPRHSKHHILVPLLTSDALLKKTKTNEFKKKSISFVSETIEM